MARVRDRMEDFKEAVRVAAMSNGYTESQLASLISSFIMHNPISKTEFTKDAIKTMQRIKELEQFILKHRKDYVDLHRTTEQERDNIEHEVGEFVKLCKDQIDILKNRIHEEEKNGAGRTWLGMREDNSNVDLIAHKHGVVLILSEKLHSVTTQFDRLRSIRFQDSINRVMPRKMLRKKTDKANLVPYQSAPKIGEWELPTESMRIQEQVLDDETRALQIELSSLLDAVQETERKVIEVSALNHLMSTHVIQQNQQIQYLYDQAVLATQNVERGNKELSQAIQRNSGSRTFLILFFIVLTFSVLFLDWYS